MKFQGSLFKIKKYIGELTKNKTGNILIIVVMIGACLFIATSAILMKVNVNTNDNNLMNNSENAYLAAKSGIKLLEDVGMDSSFVNKVYSSTGKAAIEMDFQDLGKCDIKIINGTEAEVEDPTTHQKTKYVIAECTGKYDENEFMLRRKLKLNGTPTTVPPSGGAVSPTAAYTQFGSSEKILDGGMDGRADILNHNANIVLKNASTKNPLDSVSCLGSIKFQSSDIFANNIAAGQSFSYDRGIAVKENVYVGANNEVGTLKDDIFAYMVGHAVGGSIKCEGDLILYGFNNDGSKWNGIDRGIGSSNYDSANNKLIAKDFDAIRAGNGSGNKVYLGYSATVAGDNKSYSNVQKQSGAGDIYGRVVVNGDLFISGGTKIYGDIVCTGKVTFENDCWDCRIYGNIYADSVEFKGTGVIGNVFPNKSTITVQNNAKGLKENWWPVHEFVEDTAFLDALKAKGVTLTQKDTVSELSGALGGAGSVAYFNNLISANGNGKRPKTVFPSELASLKDVQFANPACDDATIASYAEGKCRTGNNPWSFSQQDANVLHITKSCAIGQNIELYRTGGKLNYIYIDTAALNQNIDVYLKGGVQIHRSGDGNNYAGIILNDNGGQNRIRLFMGEGSGIKFEGNDASYPGFLVVSDASKNLSAANGFTNLPGTVYADEIDQSKVPNFYIFAEEPADLATNPNAVSTTTISLGQSGYIPGCVLTPYVDILSDGNSNCYINNTKVGYKAPDSTPDPVADYDDTKLPTLGGPAKDANNRPFVYGMLMCNWAKLQGGTLTSVVFNSDLIHDPAVKKHYEDATNGVYFYEGATGGGGGTGGGSGSGGSGVMGYNWVIETIM